MLPPRITSGIQINLKKIQAVTITSIRRIRKARASFGKKKARRIKAMLPVSSASLISSFCSCVL